MAHDQAFKELLRAFFREFLELFFPEVAARLDFDRVTFLDREVFTDIPEGSVREPDVLAQVYTLEGVPELILCHIEVQAKRDRDFSFRMFEYFGLLRLRHRLPVFPVVIYLTPGAGGLIRETYTETLFGEEILSFRYRCVGLPDLRADDYRRSENPLGPALSALMKPAATGRAQHKADSLQQAVRSPVDDARRMLLVYIVDSYLKLSDTETEEFERIIHREELTDVTELLTSWEQRGIERGDLRGKREMVLDLARHRFGEAPDALMHAILESNSTEHLSRLLRLVADASCPEDLELG